MKILKSKKFLVFLLALFIFAGATKAYASGEIKGNIIAHIKNALSSNTEHILKSAEEEMDRIRAENLRKLKTI